MSHPVSIVRTIVTAQPESVVRLLGLIASVAIHCGLVAVLAGVGLPANVAREHVLAAELVAAEPPPPPPPPPARVAAPPKSRPKPLPPPETLPKLIEAPPPKVEEREIVTTAPPPPPPVAPPAVAPTPVAPPASEPRPSGPAVAATAPKNLPASPPAAASPPPGVSMITSEPPVAPRAAPSQGPPGPTATATDTVTRTAIPRGGYQVRPSYPASARRLGLQGTTLLRVHVNAEGRIDDVVVETSAGHADLDHAAADAVRRWRFEPARRGNDPVAMWVRLPVEFRLK